MGAAGGGLQAGRDCKRVMQAGRHPVTGTGCGRGATAGSGSQLCTPAAQVLSKPAQHAEQDSGLQEGNAATTTRSGSRAQKRSTPAASACSAELVGASTVAGLEDEAPSTLKKL